MQIGKKALSKKLVKLIEVSLCLVLSHFDLTEKIYIFFALKISREILCFVVFDEKNLLKCE